MTARAWIWFLVLLPLFLGTASAQNCAPGPKCIAAGERLKQYTAQMQARLARTTGIANAAMMNFCVTMVGAEVSRVCADEQLRLGQRYCADLARRQEQAYLENAKTSETIVKMSSQGPWREKCGW